jgi:hypothetical protein
MDTTLSSTSTDRKSKGANSAIQSTAPTRPALFPHELQQSLLLVDLYPPSPDNPSLAEVKTTGTESATRQHSILRRKTELTDLRPTRVHKISADTTVREIPANADYIKEPLRPEGSISEPSRDDTLSEPERDSTKQRVKWEMEVRAYSLLRPSPRKEPPPSEGALRRQGLLAEVDHVLNRGSPH